MKYNTLDLSVEHAVLTLWLDRPDKRNALNRELLEEMSSALQKSAAGAGARALIIRGRGKVFSAGADLNFMRDVTGRDRKDLKDEAALFYDCFAALRDFPTPVISYAHGAVHGGANGLLAAADFAFCDTGTRFSFSEVKLGLVPAAVSPFIIPRTGAVRARQLMLSGEVLEGPSAVEAGLCDGIVPFAEADAFLGEMTGRILQNGPNALAETKKLFRELQGIQTENAARDLTTELIARIRQSPEALEGIKAFFEKRQPRWMENQS